MTADNKQFHRVQWLGSYGMPWERDHLDAGSQILYHLTISPCCSLGRWTHRPA
jgi:hypothetical protein